MSQDLQRHSFAPDNSPRTSESYEFGPIAIDPARHRVTRAGHTLALPPKAYELLLILVKSDGRALSRQELISTLWPDTFVEEANLTFQVSTLRKALGDGADQWIETLPKHGYRFTPEVNGSDGSHVEVDNAPQSSPEAVLPLAVRPGDVDAHRLVLRRPPQVRLVVALGVLIVAVGATLAWRSIS
jgi:DNA-binding winged helix-turn-helix (wHTH) protein